MMILTPELISLSKQLHLSVLSQGKFVPGEGLSNQDCLISLLRQAVEARDRRAEAERIRQAGLPDVKSFAEFARRLGLSKNFT